MYFDFIIASFSVILCSFPIILMNTIKIARKKQVSRAVVIYVWSRIDYYDHMRWLRWYLAPASVGQECKKQNLSVKSGICFQLLIMKRHWSNHFNGTVKKCRSAWEVNTNAWWRTAWCRRIDDNNRAINTAAVMLSWM